MPCVSGKISPDSIHFDKTQAMQQKFGLWAVLGLLIVLVSSRWLPSRAATGNVDESSCSFNGIPLYGEVQVVDSFPDIEVKEVSSFPDLNVEMVSSFPDSCGEWKIVSSSPDFTIKYVNSFPDIEIKEVTSFPGIP
jgi:hypothetical protein